MPECFLIYNEILNVMLARHIHNLSYTNGTLVQPQPRFELGRPPQIGGLQILTFKTELCGSGGSKQKSRKGALNPPPLCFQLPSHQTGSPDLLCESNLFQKAHGILTPPPLRHLWPQASEASAPNLRSIWVGPTCLLHHPSCRPPCPAFGGHGHGHKTCLQKCSGAHPAS